MKYKLLKNVITNENFIYYMQIIEIFSSVNEEAQYIIIDKIMNGYSNSLN